MIKIKLSVSCAALVAALSSSVTGSSSNRDSASHSDSNIHSQSAPNTRPASPASVKPPSRRVSILSMIFKFGFVTD